MTCASWSHDTRKGKSLNLFIPPPCLSGRHVFLVMERLMPFWMVLQELKTWSELSHGTFDAIKNNVCCLGPCMCQRSAAVIGNLAKKFWICTRARFLNWELGGAVNFSFFKIPFFYDSLELVVVILGYDDNSDDVVFITGGWLWPQRKWWTTLSTRL